MLEGALISLLIGVQAAAQATPTYRLEREPVAGGAEIVTLFGRLHTNGADREETDVPLLSVLRDTLGDDDPQNDRLRSVWILTSTRPTPLQRAASALSFMSFRTGGKEHADQVPSPALDLASPARGVWIRLLSNSVQSLRLDPLGATVRSSTRSYRGNSSDYRKVQLFQALASLDGLDREAMKQTALEPAEFRQVYSRLSLSDHTFGGLVREQNLERYYNKESSELEETRGHNWELLRQRAEMCSLYFDPLSLSGASPSEALLWIAREDLEQPQDRRFESQFLNIANPWTDERLQRWTGYSEMRYFDSDSRQVPKDTPGARAIEMIPLALYSLDYPKVPLLLADFRDTFKPKRRELVRHGATALLTGVLGFSRFGNWPFLAAETSWNFVRGRHGAAVNRTARLEAYAGARVFLAEDTSLDPNLARELTRRLDHLALNPLENDFATQASVAKEQYAALLQYADSPSGLAAKLERDRQKELEAYQHSRAWRWLAGIGHLFTGGPHFDPEKPDMILRAELDSRRRAAGHVRYLDRLLASSPRPEVVRKPSEIQKTIDALSIEPDVSPRASGLIAKVFTRSEDSDVRFTCLRALRRLNVQSARTELWRLSQDPATTESWRTLCLLYFSSNSEPGTAGLAGGQ